MLKKLTKTLLVFAMMLQVLMSPLAVDAVEAHEGETPATYVVTVEGGTGSRTDVEAGETVTVAANNPAAGQQFVRWESVGTPTVSFANAMSQTTTFTMPSGDVTVRAVFEAIPTFTAIVEGGTGGGNFPVGATVNITATPPSGQRFARWEAVGTTILFGNLMSSTTSFTMPARDVTIRAIFEPIPTFTATVNGGTGDGSFAAGSAVSIRATAPVGYRFVRWETVGLLAVTFANANSANTTFEMPARNVTVRAVFESTSITHNVRTIAIMNRTMPLRSGPGASTASQGNISQGARILIIGESADGTWVQIQAGLRTGWVNRMRVNNFRVNAVANMGVILRTGPGTNFGQNGNVSRGANVSIIAHSGEWSNIRVGNRTGWIRTERLNETGNLAVMNHSVPLRSGPGASHASLGTMTRGTRVTVLGVSNSGNWTRIRTGNNIGWVSTHRLNDLRLSAMTTAAVPLRGGPGSNFDQVGNLARGVSLHFLGQSGDWVRVQAGNTIGWIRAERITAVTTTRRVTASVPLRSGPGTSHAQVRTVANNAQVTVFGTSRSGAWSHIRVGNDVGWVMTHRLR